MIMTFIFLNILQWADFFYDVAFKMVISNPKC
jgi:hypothetical protein